MGEFSKGIATDALSLVVTITIITLLALVGLYIYFQNQIIATNQLTCGIKYSSYCLEWAKTGYDPSKPPYDWDSKSPVGCDKVKVYKPDSAKACIGAGQ